MKLLNLLILLFLLMTAFSTHAQSPPKSIDLNKYSGKWFVIGLIPTGFDKNWDYETETYTVKSPEKIEVLASYVKKGETKIKTVGSKGFPDAKSNNVRWKVQFLWPFKADYLIEEIDDDYSYVVVGHPKKKFLYIMNRTGKMDEKLYEDIVRRFALKGYEMSKVQKMKQ